MSQKKSTLAHLFQHKIVLFFAKLARLLPYSLSVFIVSWFGLLAFLILAKRRRIALQNLDRVFGSSLSLTKKIKIVSGSFQSMAVCFVELFMIPKIKNKVHHRFKLSGTEHLEEAFRKGKGVILATAHFGSWEYLSFLPYLTKRRWSCIVKDLKNPYLNKEINDLRQMTTVTPIPKLGSIKKALKELKQNHGVAILVDQWAGPEGIWVDFFGQPTSTTSIPARLAIHRDCDILPAYCFRKFDGHYHIQILPPLRTNLRSSSAEHDITLELNRRLEQQIRYYPELWAWGHRRWKPKPKSIREVSIHVTP